MNYRAEYRLKKDKSQELKKNENICGQILASLDYPPSRFYLFDI